jgi:hypothetical protein
MAAASVEKKSGDGNLPGMVSPFTRMLNDALISGAKDRYGEGELDLNDVYDYLKATSPRNLQLQRKFHQVGVPVIP